MNKLKSKVSRTKSTTASKSLNKDKPMRSFEKEKSEQYKKITPKGKSCRIHLQF